MTAALFETLQLALPLGIIQMNCFIISSFPVFHPLLNYMQVLIPTGSQCKNKGLFIILLTLLHCCESGIVLAKTLRIMVFLTQKFVIKLSKIWVCDPGPGKNLFQILDPVSKRHQIRFRNTAYSISKNYSVVWGCRFYRLICSTGV